MREEVMRLERVTLIENGVMLLDNVNLHIYRGEIMGLLCVNTHGQEELIRLICRNEPIHYGRVYFHEQLVNNHLHSSLSRNRVAVIEKQSRLVEHLTVADNVFVLRSDYGGHVIRTKELSAQLKVFTEEIGVDIRGDRHIDSLTYFERCAVELLKAVITGMCLIVVRDISNFISAVDLHRIHNLISHYARRGISFVYVCNHHEEIFQVCHKAALMENGKIVRVLDQGDMREDVMRSYGEHRLKSAARNPAPKAAPAPAAAQQPGACPALEFRHVTTANIHDLSFSVQAGECVVLLDINNTTPTDFLQLMTRKMQPRAGEIRIGRKLWKRRAEQSAAAVIQEKPTQSMVFPYMSYLDNLCFMADGKQPGIWRSRRIRESVRKEFLPFVGEEIYAPDLTMLPPRSLYNLVYYRTFFQNPRVVFCVQPFSGADMYLRRHVISLLRKLLERGIAVVILAVSLADSLQVADRLLIVKDGWVRMEYQREDLHSFGLDDMEIGDAALPNQPADT